MKRLITITIACSLLAVGCGGQQSTTETADDHAAGHPGAEADAPANSGGEHHGAGHGHHHHGQGHNHDFSDVERFARIFDAPDRDAWQRPDAVVEAMRIESGMRVADIGAGTGYFLSRLARAVGAEGAVVGYDLEDAMVQHMEGRIADDGLTQCTASTIAADASDLDTESFDRILIVDTWHHVQDRGTYARRLLESLREGGTVTVVDFTQDSPHGPPPAMRLAPEVVREELAAGGFSVVEEVETELPYQYVIVARR